MRKAKVEQKDAFIDCLVGRLFRGAFRVNPMPKNRQDLKGRFTRYDFCLRLSHAIFIARAARVMEKSYTIFTIYKWPIATIVVGF